MRAQEGIKAFANVPQVVYMTLLATFLELSIKFLSDHNFSLI